MLDMIQNAITQAGKNLFITLPKLTSEDVVNIWDAVSEFVEKQLSMNKGVQIPGLGTFSFLREKLHIGSNKSIHLQRPVFLLSEKLAQIHGLKFNKIRIPGDIPIVQLNFIVLSLDSPFNREMVEGCVRETLLSFSRSIATKQTVEFTFKGIGVLIVRDNKVKMKFYKDFLHTMDGSGTLLKALTNRPGTVDSVVSSKDTATPPFPTSNTAVFPRLEVKEMETIAEEGEKSSKEPEQLDKESSKKENTFSKRFLSRQAIFPAKVSGISLTEELEKNLKPKPPPSSRQPTPASDALKSEQEVSRIQTPAPRSQTSSPICDEHGRAGQEMCYLCMQRAQRNIPVYLGEERRRKEKADDCILAQYQAIKDHEALQKELMKREQNREQNQKVASYNLGVAEAMRKQKNEKLVEPFRSFIFEKRPPSSTPHEKQEEYAQHLDKQLETKKARDAKQKQEQDFIDRLQQVQLAEELAAQRAKYLREKLEENQTYKTALDTQIKLRPAPLPEYVPDSTEIIFGKNDMNEEKMGERKKRAREYSKYQLQAVADRKRTAILNQLVDQRRATDMIQRAKKQWIAEKGERMERLFQMNLAIQEDWRKSAGLKRQRDYEEKLFQRAGDKLMLLDQCARYRRCYQCKKDLNHFGKTNIWTDSKYIPGSRLIV
ncbi:coiled-coil domain-containing protein 81 [Notechis scutatus]|uniref:Coiled-coil domain-containing protein 81 n=1 Tax=Notechis scutatus TaxID=8663 RepID=A0A6J1UZ39_9SAUR|nr:coiled-coil domain-containing protein 81 [Notechis scutatus]